MGRSTFIILGAATFSKLALFFLCSALRHKSASALALAEDHFNDILSNSCAVATAAAASRCALGFALLRPQIVFIGRFCWHVLMLQQH